MRHNRKFLLALFAGALLFVLLVSTPGTGWGNSAGAPDGYANDPPGDQNCTACHTGFGLNEPPGTMIIDAPHFYTPGSTYIFNLTLTKAGSSVWGFELTSLLDNGDQGGILSAVNTEFVQVSVGPGNQRDYIKQTNDGSFEAQPNSATWQIRWVAPAAGAGTVTFYASGTAGNNNENPSGEYVYTFAQVIEPVASGISDPVPNLPNGYRILTAYPNPFNPTLIINLTGVPLLQPLTLNLTDIQGRVVLRMDLPAGSNEVSALPLDLSYLPSGQYILNTSLPEISPFRLVKAK